MLNELAGNAFRRQPIFAFEIPKYDGDLGTPNIYVPVSEDRAQRKVELLSKHFESQKTKPWFDESVFLASCVCEGWSAILPADSPRALPVANWRLVGPTSPDADRRIRRSGA